MTGPDSETLGGFGCMVVIALVVLFCIYQSNKPTPEPTWRKPRIEYFQDSASGLCFATTDDMKLTDHPHITQVPCYFVRDLLRK